MSNITTVTIVQWTAENQDFPHELAEAVFEGDDRRTEAEQWARTALIAHREITTFCDDVYAYLDDGEKGSDVMKAYAYLHQPNDEINWEDDDQ